MMTEFSFSKRSIKNTKYCSNYSSTGLPHRGEKEVQNATPTS